METDVYKNQGKDMDQHVRILGWLYIASGILTLIIGACTFVFMAFAGVASGEGDAMIGLSVLGLIVAAIIGLFTIPGLLTGWGLLNRQSWARILAIIFGALNLFSFPLGTALGIYAFWVLLPAEASDYFS